jgi:hypothetical protein
LWDNISKKRLVFYPLNSFIQVKSSMHDPTGEAFKDRGPGQGECEKSVHESCEWLSLSEGISEDPGKHKESTPFDLLGERVENRRNEGGENS